MQGNVLVVEDDADINQVLCTFLERQGHLVESAFSGSEARLLLSMHDYDLILLDLMLPGITGEELVKLIRSRSYVPIIILSAKVETKDKIELLANGADDFITKPFEKEEVLARVEAQLRRYKQFSSGVDSKERESQILAHRELVIDLAARTVRIADETLSLTTKEFDLLVILMREPGKVFTREALYQAVWKEKYAIEDNTINVHMSHLRSKLAQSTVEHHYIETVWGIGFKLV